MPKMIFVNLPVADVAASTAFYAALGFVRNDKFSNEHAASMVWSDAIVVMLLAKPFFATFTDKAPIDARSHAGALFALSLDSRAEVDRVADAAIAAGGRALHDAQEHGFMYGRAFEDLDGHGFQPFWMEPEAVEKGPEAYAAQQG